MKLLIIINIRKELYKEKLLLCSVSVIHQHHIQSYSQYFQNTFPKNINKLCADITALRANMKWTLENAGTGAESKRNPWNMESLRCAAACLYCVWLHNRDVLSYCTIWVNSAFHLSQVICFDSTMSWSVMSECFKNLLWKTQTTVLVSVF